MAKNWAEASFKGDGGKGGERGSNGVATALILPVRQDENKRIVADFRQYFVRNRGMDVISKGDFLVTNANDTLFEFRIPSAGSVTLR